MRSPPPTVWRTDRVRPLPTRVEAQARLGTVFPRAAFDPALSNPLAAAAVAAMLYVDAVVPDTGDVPDEAVWVRPSLCLWMSDEVYVRATPAERARWRHAALVSRQAVEVLESSWGLPTVGRWYRDNSREPLRDETFAAWLEHGAIRDRPGVPTTSSKPRWALTSGFADLFSTSLSGHALEIVVEDWRASRMTPGDLLRVATLRDRQRATHATQVRLPGRRIRSLEPGLGSRILRGVIEEWVPARLRDPVVLSISEPGDKVYLADAARLRALGLTLNPGNLLPDAVVVDIGTTPPTFWIIEAVATDGPVTESRRRHLLQ